MRCGKPPTAQCAANFCTLPDPVPTVSPSHIAPCPRPPFFWLVVSWYAVSLVLFCCGGSSTLMGYKRFPAKPVLRHVRAAPCGWWWCGVLTAVVGSWRHCADQRDEAIFQPVSPEDSPLPFTQADRRSFTTLQLQSTSETTPLLTAGAGATAVAVPPATASGPPPSGATVAGANTYDAPDWAAARPTPAPVRAALPPSAPPLHVASENGKFAKLAHH